MKFYTYLLYICFLFFSSVNISYAEDGQQFRNLLRELIIASNPSTSKEMQVQNLTDVINQHSTLIVEWILKLQKISTLMEKGKLEVQKSSSVYIPQYLIDYLDPFNYPLIWEPTKAIISKIDQKAHLEDLLPESTRFSMMISLSKKINDTLRSLDLGQGDLFSVLMDPSIQNDMQKIGTEYQDFFQSLLIQYFHFLPLQMKRHMLIDYLAVPIEAPLDKKFLAIIQNCGPVMQKLLQLIGKYSSSPQLRPILQKLKANVRTDSVEQVQTVVQSALGRTIPELFSEFDPTPLHSGTIGQLHHIKIKLPYSEVVEGVVKVQHMYAEIESRDELKVLQKIPNLDRWGHDLLQKVRDSIQDELNFKIEAQNIQKGFKTYHHPEESLTSIQILNDLYKEKALVMSMAHGRPIEEWSREEVEKLGIEWKDFLILKMHLLYRFTNFWFKEALFGSGFFHADPHDGNFHLDLHFDINKKVDDPSNKSLIENYFEQKLPSIFNQYSYLLTTLDYGNCGQLSETEREAIIEITAGLLLGWPNKIMSGISLIATFPTPMSKDILEKEVKRVATDTTAYFGNRFYEINLKMVELGVILPPSFHQFNRARTFLQQQLLSVNEELDQMDPNQKIPRLYSADSYIKETLLALLQQNKESFTAPWRSKLIGSAKELKWAIQFLIQLAYDFGNRDLATFNYLKNKFIDTSCSLLEYLGEKLCAKLTPYSFDIDDNYDLDK